MEKNLITLISREFKETIETIVAQILIKSKVPANSDLIKTIELKDNSRTYSLYIWVNSYYEHLINGRKVGVKKVPIHALVRWLKKYNIKSNRIKDINQLAFAIQKAIFKNGIRGRNFISKVNDSVTDFVELKVSEEFETLVADSMVKALTFNGKFISSD